MAMKPSTAPTTMKTVPSGRLLVCINGAFFVDGTIGVTTVAIPVSVGRSVGRPAASVPVDPPVMLGTEAVSVPVEPPVMEMADLPVPVVLAAAPVVAALVFPVVAADVLPVFVAFVALERLGRPVAPASCAIAPMARETASAAESKGVLRNNLMMYVMSEYGEEGLRVRRRGRVSRISLYRLSAQPGCCCLLTSTMEGSSAGRDT